MCGETFTELAPEMLVFRSLKELEEDFAKRRRPRPALRPLEELVADFKASRCQRALSPPRALRSLKELTADFKARQAASRRTERLHEAYSEVTAADGGCWGSPSYGRDELLAVLACMQLPDPEVGPGFRAAPRIGAPPGLSLEGDYPEPSLDAEDPSLDDEELLARMEAREDRERGADARNSETFGPHTEVWALQQQALEEAVLEAGEYWWDAAGEQQYYAEEDIWSFRESFMGAHDHFWGYGHGFEDHFVGSDIYDGLDDKSVVVAGVKDAEACQSSTAPTDKASDAESRGDEADVRQASCW